jgi:hypothetical protein
MLRLRFLEGFPRAPDGEGTLFFSVSATNESGSPQTLAAPLELALEVTDTSGLQLSPPLALRVQGAALSCAGRASVSVAIKQLGKSAAPCRLFRLRISSAGGKEAQLIPASLPREKAQQQQQGKWRPTLGMSVCTMHTPVICLGEGGELALPEDAWLASPHSASLHTLLPVVGVGAGRVSILERHTSVTPGFGNIVWDTAILMAGLIPSLCCSEEKGSGGGRGGGGGAAAIAGTRGRAGAAAAPLRGKAVIDLGSGTGIVGIAAALLGASVTLTDLPSMLPTLQGNAAVNARAIGASGGSVQCVPLVWGASHEAAGGVLKAYDLVLASECVYSQEQFEPFLSTLLQLCGRGTRVLLGTRKRACCVLEDFLGLIRNSFEAKEVALGDTGEASALLAQCSAMSKTQFTPQLFVLKRKEEGP